MLGFHIRTKMTAIVFCQDEKKLNRLKNSIKSCIYLNRILREGMKCTFDLVKLADEDEDEDEPLKEVKVIPLTKEAGT